MAIVKPCTYRKGVLRNNGTAVCNHPRVHTPQHLVTTQICSSCRYATDQNVSPSSFVGYDVDVFVPYFRDLDLVPQTVDSILYQTAVKPLIHLVNDCSPENDASLKRKYANQENLRWYRTRTNGGPYRIANGLFYHTASETIAIVDSDDILLPDHLAYSLECLHRQAADACGSSMQQFLNPGENHSDRCQALVKQFPVIHSGELPATLQYPTLINGTMVIRKTAFKKLNGFDGSMFCGADREFIQRLQYSHQLGLKICSTGKVTALRRVRGNSLSHHDPRFGFRSNGRATHDQKTRERCEKWNQLSVISPAEYGTLDQSHNVLDEVETASTRMSGQQQAVHDIRRSRTITACLASIPRRESALKKTVSSLLPQVDYLKIHLNGYEVAPVFLNHPKIEVTIGDNSRGDNAKFFCVDKLEGYVFTCDDDLLYPPTYVETMVGGVNEYRCLVGASGASFSQRAPLSSFLDGISNHPLQRKIDHDVTADIVGTGTLCFHTDDITLKYADFVDHNMADLSLLRIARKRKLPRKILRHPDQWITRTTSDDGIYEQTKIDDHLETNKVNEILKLWPDEGRYTGRLAVVLVNYKRETNTNKIIQQLKQQSCRPEIIVWNNGPGEFTHPDADWVIDSNRNEHGHPMQYLYQGLGTEYVCHIDDDLIPGDPEVLADILKYMDCFGRSRRIVGGYGVILNQGRNYRDSTHVGCGPHYAAPIAQDTLVDIVKGRFMVFRQEFADEICFDRSHVHIDLSTSFSLSQDRRLFHVIPHFLEGRLLELNDEYDDKSGKGYCRQAGHFETRNRLTQQWLHQCDEGIQPRP